MNDLIFVLMGIAVVCSVLAAAGALGAYLDTAPWAKRLMEAFDTLTGGNN